MMKMLLGGTAALALWPTIASAQTVPNSATKTDSSAVNTGSSPAESDSGGDAAMQTGEIIVTANRRAEALSRVGITVSVVGADQLQKQEIRQALDLARVVPGLQIETAGLTGSPVYILRGVGFDTPNATSTAPVGTYVDEVAYAYPYMSLGTNFDLERVEVLKGPQGTLYGRNSTGGLINLVTGKPTSTPKGALSVAYGSYQTLLAEGFISGPLSSTLKARLAFQTETRNEGWQRSVSRPNDRLGKLYRKAVRGTLQWDPADVLSVTASGTYWELGGEPQAPQAIAYVGPAALVNPLTAASIIPKPTSNRQADWTPASYQPNSIVTGIIRPFYNLSSKFYGGALKANLDLGGGISLASSTSYNRLTFDSVSEANGSQAESQTAASKGFINSFAQELRLIGDNGPLNWSVGGYYATDKTSENNYGYVNDLSTIVGLRGAAIGLNTLFGNPVSAAALATSFRQYAGIGNYKNRVLAGFANAEYELGDQLKVSAGARYTEDYLRGSGCGLDTNGNNAALVNFLFPILTRNPNLAPIQPNSCYTLTADNSAFVRAFQGQKQHNVSWRGRVDYTPSDHVLVYASVSRGFKAGSFPSLAASSVTQLAPVTQEKLTAYEGGFKINMLDRRLQLNASAFYYDYLNHQIFGRIPDLVFGTLQRVVNIPKSRIYGAEADINFRVSSTLRIQASGSYLNAEVKNYTGFDNAFVAQLVDFSGSRLPYSPKFQGNGSITNDMPIGDGNVMLFTSLYGSYQSRSSSVLGDAQGFEIKAYGILGAKAGIHAADDQWAIEGYVNNLTNTYYWTSAQRQSETLVRYTGMPRTIGVRGSFKF